MAEQSAPIARRRRVAVIVLLVIGAITLPAAVVTAYIRDAVIDADEFAANADTALSTPEVQAAITTAVVDQIVEVDPELLAVRPLIESVVDGIVRSDVFGEIFTFAIKDLHRTVLTGDDTVTMKLADLLLVAKTQLTVLDPELGALIPDQLTDAIIEVQTNPVLIDTLQLGEDVRIAALILPIVAILSFGTAVALSADRRRTLRAVGALAVLVALLVLAFAASARAGFLQAFDEGTAKDTATAFWDAFTGDFTVWALALAGIGAALWFLAWLSQGEATAESRVQAMWASAPRPATPGRQAVVAVAAILAGALLVAEWQLFVGLAATVSGVALVIHGLAQLIRLAALRRRSGGHEERHTPSWYGRVPGSSRSSHWPSPCSRSTAVAVTHWRTTAPIQAATAACSCVTGPSPRLRLPRPTTRWPRPTMVSFRARRPSGSSRSSRPGSAGCSSTCTSASTRMGSSSRTGRR